MAALASLQGQAFKGVNIAVLAPTSSGIPCETDQAPRRPQGNTVTSQIERNKGIRLKFDHGEPIWSNLRNGFLPFWRSEGSNYRDKSKKLGYYLSRLFANGIWGCHVGYKHGNSVLRSWSSSTSPLRSSEQSTSLSSSPGASEIVGS